MPTALLPELTGRSILIWTLRTQVGEDVSAAFEQVLARDERQRAAQFRVAQARESFVVTRAVLRILLGRYLGAGAGAVRLQYGAFAKPAIAPDSSLRFNVTHSGDNAAIALTIGCEIGIDLDGLRPLPELEQIATRFFCPDDAAEILSQPPEQRERAFFTCWTRKEAYIKATGAGLSMPLTSFRVVQKPDGPGDLAVRLADGSLSESWTVHDLRLAPNSAAAIAYNDSPRPVSIVAIDDLQHLLEISAGN